MGRASKAKRDRKLAGETFRKEPKEATPLAQRESFKRLGMKKKVKLLEQRGVLLPSDEESGS